MIKTKTIKVKRISLKEWEILDSLGYLVIITG